jgi:hypothetical protein
MKELLLTAILFALTLGFSSCENATYFDRADLIGTWELTHKHTVDKTTGEIWDEEVDYINKLTLNGDGTTFSYVLVEDDMYENGRLEANASGKWKLSDDKLFLHGNEDDAANILTIKDLTSTTLTVSYADHTTVYDIEHSMRVTRTYKKMQLNSPPFQMKPTPSEHD